MGTNKSQIETVSIIVCTRNKPNDISILLYALCTLAVPTACHVELILVNNAASKEVKIIAHSYKYPFEFKYVEEPHIGHSIALNRGIKESKGDLLLFFDDDAYTDRNWLFEYVVASRNYPDAGYFFGKIKPLYSKKIPYWWDVAPRSLKGRDQGESVIKYSTFSKDCYPIGVNMAVKRNALPTLQPFDISLGPSQRTGMMGGADTKLGKQIMQNNFLSYYVPTAIVYHRINSRRMNWNYIVRRSYLEGRASVKYRDIPKIENLFSFPLVNMLLLCKSCLSMAIMFTARDKLATCKEFIHMCKICGYCHEFLFGR